MRLSMRHPPYAFMSEKPSLSGVMVKGAVAGLGLAAVEMAARVLWRKLDSRRGLRLTHQIRRDWLADLPADRLSPMIQVPYGLYWNRPQSLDGNGVQQTNEYGYRQGSTPTAVPKPPGRIRVLALGGSTTFSDRGASAPKDAWPARLETSLQDLDTGMETVEVVNAGLNYALSSAVDGAQFGLLPTTSNAAVTCTASPSNASESSVWGGCTTVCTRGHWRGGCPLFSAVVT